MSAEILHKGMISLSTAKARFERGLFPANILLLKIKKALVD